MFSGWGVRNALHRRRPASIPCPITMVQVWPHDNAVIAMGLSRYGLKRGASAIFEGLFDAARIWK